MSPSIRTRIYWNRNGSNSRLCKQTRHFLIIKWAYVWNIPTIYSCDCITLRNCTARSLNSIFLFPIIYAIYFIQTVRPFHTEIFLQGNLNVKKSAYLRSYDSLIESLCSHCNTCLQNRFLYIACFVFYKTD